MGNTELVLDLLRSKLLALHKTLLDAERNSYERVNGKVAPGEFLNLLMQDEHFAWLRTLSQLIVWIDEVLDPHEPTAEEEKQNVFQHARKLLTPSQLGDEFVRKYQDALQRNPDAVMAHKEVRDVLKLYP